MCREIKIHSKQPEAMARARERAAGKRDQVIKSEDRVRHLEDFIGLWNAAIKAWRDMAEKVHAKYESTAEYEIVSGLPIMLVLEERKYGLPYVISTNSHTECHLQALASRWNL